MEKFHEICITGIAATVTALLGIESHKGADKPIDCILKKAQEAFGENGCDRVFLYNPDAIAAWIYEEYRQKFADMEEWAELGLPMLSVVPPVTPVCFGSMYSGMQPAEHGIRKYEKPVLKVDTLFDDMVRAGRKAAVVSTAGDSISRIFLEREIEYYIYPDKQQCNEKALELIEADRHQLIVLYNGDYDYYMHRFGPKGRRPIRALEENIATCNAIHAAVKQHWRAHNTVIGFAPDHGCHRTCLLLGSHGVDKPCDMNIMHFYGFIPRGLRT